MILNKYTKNHKNMRNTNLEQIRQQSLRTWSDAQRKALHEAVKNTPVNPIAPATAAGLGTGSGGALDDTVNNYVVNDYVENYFE
jgi:hypothetical protein